MIFKKNSFKYKLYIYIYIYISQESICNINLMGWFEFFFIIFLILNWLKIKFYNMF